MPHGHFINGTRASRPADRPAMRMVRVKDFGSAVHEAELCGITHVGTRNRRGGITEGIGTIPHRFILKAEILVLHMHVIDSERLAPIIDRATAWTIRVR